MIIIDFETMSEVDLKNEGVMRYAMHPSTRVLVLGYEFNNEGVQQWFPGDPPFSIDGHTIYAFNAGFDVLIWNRLMPHFGFEPIDLYNVVDIQALCGRYGLPQNLHDVSRVLKTGTLKDSAGIGKRLIQLFCTPPFGRENGVIRREYEAMWKDFLLYNKDDVSSSYDVLHSLPSMALNESENKIWRMNYKLNMRGIPVDVDNSKRILEVTQVYLEEHNGRLPELTNGKVTKVSQVKRIVDWINSQGVAIDNLQKETVEDMLMRDDLPDNVIEVLELRAGLGLSSIGKYKRIVNMEYNGRMYHNSRYYGAHTGRITGMGFQLLNLPRAKVKDPEAEIEKFVTGDIVYENPVLSARALIRPMIKAPEGSTLMVADFSSIEYIALMWAALDRQAVQRFDEGFDPYKDLAMEIYHRPYEEIDGDMRQMGKVGILGCGYGLGTEGFIAYADKFGMTLSYSEADRIVKAFRVKYNKCVKFWYALKDAATMAIQCHNQDFTTHNVNFKCVRDVTGRLWLAMRLQSGRTMYYAEPDIRPGKFGEAVTVMGMNQVTRQYERKYMTPGKFAENVIQAICRDILYHGKFKVDQHYMVIGSIYDEIICEVPEAKANLDHFIDLMCTKDTWYHDMPVKAKGYISKRYKKD